MKIVQMGQQGGGDERRSKTLSLLDVFAVIARENFPVLWNVTLKNLSTIPTTASCEQLFSRLRHKHHDNMNKETSFSFLSFSQKRKTFILNENKKDE